MIGIAVQFGLGAPAILGNNCAILLYCPPVLCQPVKTDSLFYKIFQTYPALFFELIGSSCPKPGAYRFLSQEVKQTSFRIDGVLVPPDNDPEQLLYFVEFQGYRDLEGDLYSGFFSEILMYLNDYRPIHDWCGVLIFTQRSLDPGLPIHYQDYANSPHFQRFYLDEMADAMAGGSLELGIVRLLGLAETVAAAEARDLLARSSAEVSDARTQQKIVELVETIFVYKFPTLSSKEISDMLRLSDLKHTRVYQEGREEEGFKIILSQLQYRLGGLAPELETQVERLSLPQVEALGKALLDFSQPQDLVLWLQANLSAD